MTLTDQVILLIVVYVGTYLVFDRIIFRALARLNPILRIQTMLRFGLLAMVLVLTTHPLWHDMVPVKVPPLSYNETLKLLWQAALGWIGTELLLGVFSSFVKSKPEEDHGI